MDAGLIKSEDFAVSCHGNTCCGADRPTNTNRAIDEFAGLIADFMAFYNIATASSLPAPSARRNLIDAAQRRPHPCHVLSMQVDESDNSDHRLIIASVRNAATPDLVEDKMSFIAVHEFGVAQNAKLRTALERFSVDVNRSSKGVPRGVQIRFVLL